MVIDLNGNLGSYGIRVNNPSGAQSNTFNFTAQAPPATESADQLDLTGEPDRHSFGE
jgi:hypothetical protein